ncbi:hypothetical protein [Vibrio coralliilyticus]|uniref:hypothetical protein n=1 Tax=Vibrio coralliilyticus TaxID=190893 RepID=UPI00155F8AB1|nr:hypothetical protein [Vibrio coralliilyticus]NRF60932.1 hypothetical protein [Vibrio coralliilyticus]
MLDIIVSSLTIIASIIGVGIAIWSYVDTKRRYTHQEFLKQIDQDNKEADIRFQKRTRLGKRD